MDIDEETSDEYAEPKRKPNDDESPWAEEHERIKRDLEVSKRIAKEENDQSRSYHLNHLYD